ncbi:MAG: lysophospholipid acyltransferase family protein [Proteobacteria bacterium]|jgi:KDO2-lipid IV(A) lauroyltransferase|nr:lysophospholipid acyltransferase family protein [Pseudomonadota bacterium]
MNFSIRLFKVFSFLVYVSPFWFQKAIGDFLAWLWFDGLKFRRFTVLKNIQRAFPEMTHEQKYRLARKSMKHLCFNFVEILKLPHMKAEDFQMGIFHGLENYQQAHARGKGVLLLSMHLGSGDIACSMIAQKGIPLHVISKKFKNKAFNEFWFGMREGHGARFMDPHGAHLPFEILKATRKGEPVVFVLDQYMGKPYGIEIEFFGIKTGAAYGLALFAIKTKAPVIPVYTYRDDHYQTHVVFGPEVPLIQEEDRDLQIQKMTQEYTKTIENLVRKYPEHWMWVHRRWKRWK